jgi:hypothetical protein
LLYRFRQRKDSSETAEAHPAARRARHHIESRSLDLIAWRSLGFDVQTGNGELAGMKAEELRLDELVRFGEGLVDIHGRRLIIQDTLSFGQFVRDLSELVGQEGARRIMTRWGYF